MNSQPCVSSKTPILFTHFGDNQIRGSERCLIDLIKHLDKTQYRAIVWCNSAKMRDECSKLNIPVYQTSFTILFGWEKPKFNFKNYHHMVSFAKKLIEQFGIQLLHSNSGAPCQWLQDVSQQTNTPLVNHLHATYVFRDRVLLKLHQANMTIGVSQPVIDQLTKDGVEPERLRVIPNGIDTERLQQQPLINLRNKIKACETDTIIASVGSLVHLKGMDLIIEAVKRLKDENLSIKLIILGEGPERASLTAQIESLDLQSEVFLLGESEVPFGILKGTADIFVSGSRQEAFGLVLAEAGLAGLPSIAPKVGGIPSVVKDQHTGIVIEPENPQAITDAVKQLMHTPSLHAAMGQKAKEHVMKHFTIQKNVHAIESVYQKLLLTNMNKRAKNWSKFRLLFLCLQHIKSLLLLKLKKTPVPKQQEVSNG